MVAYLEKSEANADFAEIVDFLNASPISYALTTIVITESSVRRDLHFDDEDGITCLTNTEIFENLQLMGFEKLSDKLTFLKPFFSPQWKYLIHTILQCLSSKSTAWNEFDEAVHEERGDIMERAATTAASLDAEQDSEAIGDTIAQTRSERVSTPFYDTHLLGVNTPRSDEERIKLKELIDMCTKLSDRVLDLENVKDAQALEIIKLKKRVKNIERKNKSRTLQPKRRVYKPRVESSEESLEVIADQEETIELVEDKGSAEKGVSAAEDKDSTADSQTLMAIRSSALRPQNLKGVLFKELSEPTTITTSRPQPQIPAKDKGKGIMQEPEKLVKVKGKDTN
ncbi:hypothetical protein Tco_1509074 [Tanacetum coccineum]